MQIRGAVTLQGGAGSYGEISLVSWLVVWSIERRREAKVLFQKSIIVFQGNWRSRWIPRDNGCQLENSVDHSRLWENQM